MKRSLPALFLFIATCVSAITIDKVPLTNRAPGTFQVAPKAVLNTRTGETLVVWVQHHGGPVGHAIWGHLLSTNGSPLGPSFLIVNGPHALQPDLVYNPMANRFVLIYANDLKLNNRFAVFAIRLTPKGRRAGKAIRISDPADAKRLVSNQSPRVVYDSNSDEYATFWLRIPASPATPVAGGLYAAIYNRKLKITKPAVLLHPLLLGANGVRGPFLTDVVFHDSGGKILLAGYVLQDSPIFSWNYFVSSIKPDLQKPSIRLLTVNPSPSGGAEFDAKLAVAKDGKPFVVFVEGTGLKRRFLSARFRPTGPVTPFFNPPLQNTKVEFPEVNTDTDIGSSNRFVVAVEVNVTPEKIWLQSFTTTGAAERAPFEIASSTDRILQPAVLLLPATDPLTSRYGLIYVEGRQQFPPGANDSSGLVLLNLTLTP